MSNTVTTPFEAYAFPNLPPPSSWEKTSAVVQAARERLEQRISERVEKLKAEKKAALNLAIKKANAAVASGAPNAAALKMAVNKARAAANVTSSRAMLPRGSVNDNETKKLYEDIQKFKNSVEFEQQKRTASAKSASATTPPHIVYKDKMLAKLKAYKSRNPGAKLNRNTFKKFKGNVMNTFKASSQFNMSKADPNSYFFSEFEKPTFKGGKTRKMRK